MKADPAGPVHGHPVPPGGAEPVGGGGGGPLQKGGAGQAVHHLSTHGGAARPAPQVTIVDKTNVLFLTNFFNCWTNI